REVPGLVQAPPRDARPRQSGEDSRVAGPLSALLRPRSLAVSQPRKPARRTDQATVCVAQVAQGDRIRVPLDEALARMDQQIGALRRYRRVVQFRPDQLPAPGLLIDDGDRLVA